MDKVSSTQHELRPLPIVLGSVSPRRALLLGQLGVPFEVVPSRAEEQHDESLPTAQLCRLNAAAKAREVAQARPEALVIGADTLVALAGRIYGKPRDLAHARQILAELSGRTHQVVTGVCLFEGLSGRCEEFSVCTEVTFRPIGSREIEAYLEAVPVLDKAGAYAVQERGELIVERVAGSLSNVIGLPLEALSEALARRGYIVRSDRAFQ